MFGSNEIGRAVHSLAIIGMMGGAHCKLEPLSQLPLDESVLINVLLPTLCSLEEAHGNYAVLEKQARQLMLVNKQMNRAVKFSQSIWRSIFCARYWKQNPKLKVKSWYRFYMKRVRMEREEMEKSRAAVEFIENCDMEFECPMRFKELQKLPGTKTERFCDKCQRIVYRTDNIGTLKELSQRGQCVSFHVKKMIGRQVVAHTQHTGCFVL